jgi:hypothetical protein
MNNNSPEIFNKTIYRLPTKEELIDVNNHHLNADEIIKGFTYTIVGKGIKSNENKQLIIKSIKMLSELFPNNQEYRKALYQVIDLNESKLIQIINEEISAIRKDREEEIFDYHSIIEDAWDEPKKAAQIFQRINFDFENDDSTGEKKRFFVKKNLRKNQPIKYEFNAELIEAGGDWEMPVMYFRLEFTSDYSIMCSDDEMKKLKPEFVWDLPRDYKGLYHNYCIIPPVEAGNKLVKGESDSGKYDWFAYQNNDLSKEDEKKARITDEDKKKAWDWLAKLLEKLVNERHEMLDDDNRSKPSEPDDKDSAE